MSNTIYTSKQLHYQDNNSDKVYNVAIEETSSGLYVVNFAYGRRGSTLQTGTKTSKPVPIAAAENIARKLITEKLNKGYIDISNGQGQVHITTVPKVRTEIQPMLLSPIDEEDVTQYLEDDEYFMQEKLDGERRLIKVVNNLIIGINRKGQQVALPEAIEKEMAKITGKANHIFDGEQIGDHYYAFDLIESNPNITSYSFRTRYQSLAILLSALPKNSNIHLVPAAEGFAAKSKLYEKLQAENKEGIVFKNGGSLYVAGRNNKDALKYKFYETASFVVSSINAQRSVQIAVMAGAACLPVGNVTILPNFPVPAIGAVVEVRYLYAYAGGSVYQPIYLGERSDISPSDCSMSQLKYKPNISLI